MPTKISSTNTKFTQDTDGLEIPKGTNAQRVNSQGRIRFNTTDDNFEYYDGTQWVALEGQPSISSITPTNVREIDSGTTTTFTVTGTSFKTGITAVLIGNNSTEIAFDSVTRDSTTQLTCVMTNGKITLPNLEPYDIKVTNPSGNTFTLNDQVNINNTPYFVTASGQIGSTQRFGPFSEFVEAIDPESQGVTYRIVGGALPTGFSLNSTTGEISAASWALETENTTYNFTIQAEDSASNFSQRAFNIVLSGPVSESFTSSGTFSVPTGVTAVQVLVVAGGGGGGTGHGGGGGAGGLVFATAEPVTPGGSVPITVSPRSGQNGQGSASSFGTAITTTGGGSGGTGGHEGGQGTTRSGGSGGGGGSGQGGAAGTQGPSGTGTGFGNAGASGPSPNGGGGGGAGAGGSGKSGGVGNSYTIADGSNPVFYAGGGGGGGAGGQPGGPGGNGGGGGGSGPYYDSASPGSPGTTNRGGGGGGGVRGTSMQGMNFPPSTGAEGIVIVRY
jgi:hypothetical protein